MPIRNRLILTVLLSAVVAFGGRPNAQAPVAAFHGIGDLPGGGVGSAVRDATRVGETIYAVGASTVNATGAVPNLDTPALWTWPGSGTGTLEALPYFAGVSNTQTTARTAYAITPDADYVASQAQATPTSTGTRWVRVTRSLLPSSTANLDLNAGTGATAFAALAISESGSVVYGQNQASPGGVDTRVAVRYEDGVGFSSAPLPPGKTWSYPVPRGTSTDGLVMVGYASTGPAVVTTTPGGPTGGFSGTNTVAFRYEHQAGTLSGTTSVIPLLTDGGTWNMPAALSATGDQTVVVGNSTRYPNGEVYLTNAANTITARLGSPNSAWMPRALGGMTSDGSVIAVTFGAAPPFGPGQISGLGIPTGNKHAYIHNSHGWFHFSSILQSQGIDLVALGWDPANLAITGIRTIDGVDLVFGQGRRKAVGTLPNGTVGFIEGAVEGFVAELPQGVLASFNPQPTAPVDPSLVGAWAVGDPGNPALILVFRADGVLYRITPTGFERSLYTWGGNANGGAFRIVTLTDTDGGGGSNRNGESGQSIIVSGDTASFSLTTCPACPPFAPLTRVTGSAGSIVGAWIGQEQSDTLLVVLLGSTGGNRLYQVFDFSEFQESGIGTYTWDPISRELVVTEGNGHVDDGNFVTLSPDGLSVHVVGDDGDIFDLTRVIDPTTIPVIANTPLVASGVAGQNFSLGITATNAATFGAIGLPGGLSIDAGTGEISGTPIVGGEFAVAINATSAVGVSDIETLTLTIAIPTPAGQNVVVEPEVPEGQGPITVSFGEVTAAGTTTVTLLDLDEAGVPPPGSVDIAGVVYNVTTTATYQGLITLCFSYAGIEFGTATPRLFHFENNVWVDITTNVDPTTQTICGATTSLSPFAVLASNVVRTGFYAPVNPLAGYLNVAKGGATLPLKFNVFVNGVEQTTTAGLEMTMQGIACDTSAPEDDVEPAPVTGGTSLRYDAPAGHFIQNWKVPKTPGRCYMVRMTTAQDGLALTARFKVR